MANGYGISKWQDAKQINQELKNLTDQPIYCVSEDALKDVLNHFDTKCAKSKEITTEAKKYIPGGVQHNLAFNFPFPMCMEKAEGAYLYDRDGNQYIDFLQAGGPTILGSNFPRGQRKSFRPSQQLRPRNRSFPRRRTSFGKENQRIDACL